MAIWGSVWFLTITILGVCLTLSYEKKGLVKFKLIKFLTISNIEDSFISSHFIDLWICNVDL